jgi:hypothetical protein
MCSAHTASDHEWDIITRLAHREPDEREHQMSNFDDLVKRYIDTFNETDPQRRRASLEALYTADAGYTDPQHELGTYAFLTFL